MRAIIELAAPSACVACGASADGELCAGCAEGIVVLSGPLCDRCGGPRGDPCGCAGLLGFRRARSLVAFAEPARALTLALKRRGRRGTVGAVGALLADLAAAHGMAHPTVTFVPGGRASRTRGFDHVELVARSVARFLGARTAPVLRRTREGPRQADVTLAERGRNAAGRFAARPVGGPVLLVDDVFTTGATVQACSLALGEAGATTVDVVTWARTLKRVQRGKIRPGR